MNITLKIIAVLTALLMLLSGSAVSKGKGLFTPGTRNGTESVSGPADSPADGPSENEPPEEPPGENALPEIPFL